MSSANLMSRTPSTATPTWHQFERKVDEVKVSKTDINRLVMDYLVTAGYPAAANKFSVEANIQVQADEAIQERVEIRTAIHSGKIQAAIEKINELNPQILDEDTALHFDLLRLQLIELIRTCLPSSNAEDIHPALKFAESHLAPRASVNPEFLKDLERTLALLIFPSDNLSPALAALLDPSLRKEIATRVNEAILEKENAHKEARLRYLVKLRAFAEIKARAAKKDIPDKLDIGLIGDSHDDDNHRDSSSNDANDGNVTSQNPASDTVMANNTDAEPMVS